MKRDKIVSIMMSALIATSIIVQPFNTVDVNATINENVIYERGVIEATRQITGITAVASSEQQLSGNEGPASLAIDNDPTTFWHTAWDGSGEKPHNITLTFDGTYTIDKFEYLPREAGEYGERNGNITNYTLQVSMDGIEFTDVSTGNWDNDGTLKVVTFEPVQATHVRLVANKTYADTALDKYASAAELYVYAAEEAAVTEDIEITGNSIVGETLTVRPTGIIGEDLEYRYVAFIPGGIGWKELQGWSADDSYDWVPEVSGEYIIQVSVKDSEGNVKVINKKQIVAQKDLALSMSVEGNKVGGNVTIEANAKNTVGTTKYRYVAFTPNQGWIELKGWSEDTSFTFNPRVKGNYILQVQAMDSRGRVVTTQQNHAIENAELSLSTEIKGNKVGEPITVTSNGVGGIGTLQYRYVVYIPGEGWKQLKAWSTDTTCEFTPKLVGNYIVQVQVIDESGQVITVQSNHSVELGEGLEFTGTVELTGNNKVGETTTVSANVTGGDGELKYRYVVLTPENNWELLQTWSDSSTHDFVPQLAGRYIVQVEIKDSTGRVTIAQNSMVVKESDVEGPIAGLTNNWLTQEVAAQAGIEDYTKLTQTHFDEVTKIDMSNEGITEIPSEVQYLTNLQVLYVEENSLTTLPAELAKLSNLKVLLAYDNNFDQIPTVIENLSNLVVLDLSYNGISEVPSFVGSLTNLQQLALAGNTINSIPATLGNLANLTILELQDNLIEVLPTELGNLTSLTELNLGSNSIEVIPASFGGLTSLTKLHLFFNPISTLPVELGNATSLRYLDLLATDITSLDGIPEEIKNIEGIEIRIAL